MGWGRRRMVQHYIVGPETPPNPATGFKVEDSLPVRNLSCGQERLFTGNVYVLKPLTGDGLVVWPDGSWFAGFIYYGTIQQGRTGGPNVPVPQQSLVPPERR